MKKWIALFAVIGMVGVVWYVVRQKRVTLEFREPKTEKIDRGDIHVPITAPGRIEPIRRFEVKSKAGGEVIEIRVKPGDYVHKDDVLVELNPDLEQRNRDRAEADKNIAEAQLEDATHKVSDARQQKIINEATLESLKAHEVVLDADYERVRLDRERGVESSYSHFDYLQKKSLLDRNRADQKSATARITQAGTAIESAKLAETVQGEQVSKFKKILADAQERLDDTTIKAPRDGIVTDVPVSIGAKIQSGINSMTGGTVLLMMADVSTLEVVARVDEADWGKVINVAPIEALPDVPGARDAARRDTQMLKNRSGKVEIEVDAFRDEKFTGQVVRVEPQGRQNAGATVIQFAVHVEITDEQRNKLPLGAQAQVTFTVESALDTLRVPVDAVKSYAGKAGVWIPVPPGAGQSGPGKKFVACTFGINDGEFAELVAQIEPIEVELEVGQEVYTKLPADRDED